jgi:hypothetical protein
MWRLAHEPIGQVQEKKERSINVPRGTLRKVWGTNYIGQGFEKKENHTTNKRRRKCKTGAD